MLGQAAGLAFLAAVSPTSLLVLALYLGSARPRQTALFYLLGAVLMTTVIAVVVLLALRAGHLNLRSGRTPRYGLRLGLGLLALAVAGVMARRKARPPDPSRPASGIVSRLVANPRPVTALVAGLALFGPSVTFIAAVQVIATASAGTALSALGLVIVIIIDVMVVWLPFAFYLAAPKLTADRLAALNAWLRSHGRLLAVTALAVAGAFLTVDGLAGLIGGL
jgi:Sap, sulfolipid-1-addressing protein